MFAGFVTVCRASLNPNLAEAAIEEMLVQHLLTERILRKIFDIENFRERNIIVCYVSNNGFVDGIDCDGMRKHLAEDFDLIYVLDLGGNVRKNPKLSGTTHNVFGIQVGVSINLFVRKPKPKE